MKRKYTILIVTILIVGMVLFNPTTCHAWEIDNTSVSNVVVRDGRIEAFDFQFEVPSNLAETQSWLSFQTVKFDDADLTDEGTIYNKNYANANAVLADNDFSYDYGIKRFSNESFPCFGRYNIINETLTISDLFIRSDANDVYYIYLWTLYNGSFYPDILLATVEFNNGTIKVTDSKETEMVNDTFENLEAEVVEKIEINNVNFKLKVGDRAQFTGEVKNNSNKFDLVETFMSLNRESRFGSTDDENDLVEDYKYFHITDIYIKDNVNLKFDENTKVYINGVEQNNDDIYISNYWISVADENAVIIPEGYIAQAYLDETFEEEQQIALENAILQLIKEGQVTFDSDETTEAVNAAIENNDPIILDVYVSESITRSRRLHFFDEETTNAIDNKIGSNYKFAAYYEILIGVYVDGDYVGFITELSTPLPVTIPYPNGIPALGEGYQRAWKVIRYHNGQVDTLDAKQTANGISFENDKYSVFALVYEDTKINGSNNPPTGDNIILYISILILSIIGLIGTKQFLKKENN